MRARRLPARTDQAMGARVSRLFVRFAVTQPQHGIPIPAPVGEHFHPKIEVYGLPDEALDFLARLRTRRQRCKPK
jgi:hypothetical protein